MPGYRIIESVGAGTQPVNKWSDIEHHHPSDDLQERGRVYAKVNGKAEEVAGDYAGTAIYSPGGQLMVSKDIILQSTSNNGYSVPVPSPANGYIGEVNQSNGTVTILDRPGGEVMFQLRHMKIDESIKPGTKVEYGQPVGIQSGYGEGDPGFYGIHLHIDANTKYLNQADRYVRDIASGAITTDKRPANTTNLVNATPPIEHLSGKFPAPPKQALVDGKIEYGEIGPDVGLLQEKLRAANARDAKGRVIAQDGDFGDGTKQALENYQKSHNLPVTGIADRQTLTQLGVIGGQQQTPTQQAPTQQTPTQQTPTQQTPTQQTPTQQTPTQQTPTQQTPTQQAPTQQAPTQQTPTQQTPTQQAPTQQTPTQQTPTQQTPTQQTPTQQTPTQQTPTQQTPTQQTPTQQTPTQQTPTQQTPTQQTPTQQTPTQQTPTQQTPAQQTPTQQTPTQNLPADVQRAKTNIESWHLGQTSAQFETSNRGPGFISTGQGDLGGKSYGLYQLSSTQGSLAEYVGQSAKYGAEFKGLTPASAAFDAKWKEVAARDPQGFSTDQHTFIKKEFFDVQNETLKGRGVDLSGRGRAVQDMLWSTSVQYRNLTPNVVANGLKDKFGENYQLSKLSDEQIVGAVQDYKLKRNDSLFSGSPDLWPGLRDRAKNEKAELVGLAKDEQTLKTAGVKVPIDLDKGPSPNATGGRKTDPMADGVLKKGEDGPAVQRLQEALNKAGIRDAEGKPLPTTGYFREKTEAAVIKYQQQNGLEVTGKADRKTLAALGLLAPEKHQSTTGDKSQAPATESRPQVPATDGKPQTPSTESKPQVPATDSQRQPPTQNDKPLISNPDHPDNKLYQQALSNLQQLGPSAGFKSQQDMEKAAAAVAVDAKASGLKDISHISHTTGANGQAFLVAVQGDPTNAASKNAYIEYGQAVAQTVEQSTRMAEANKPVAQSTDSLQQEPKKIAMGGL